MGVLVIVTDILNWVIDGIALAKQWISPDGRTCVQITGDGSTAVDLWPTQSAKPATGSVAELTLHRTGWWESGMERLNVSAMADSEDGGAYRVGIERGGDGQFRPLLVCFEDYQPGRARKALRIDPDGSVYVYDTGRPDGWRQL